MHRAVNIYKPLVRPPEVIEANLRLLLDAAPDAMVVVDETGTVVLANLQTERMFGYEREQLVGQSLEVLVPERYRDRHQAHVSTFFGDPRMRPIGQNLELYGLRRDDSEFPVEISLSPLRTAHGTYVTAAIRDISDRKTIEQKIRTLNAELEKKVADLAATNRELESFSYSVSHDLRAPLRQIDGFSKILLDEAGEGLSEEHRECLLEICKGARHLGQLVDDLLNFSRLGRRALVLQLVSMGALVLSSVSEVQRDLEASGRIVEWHLDSLPDTICDTTLMRQVFRNLISNAVKFTQGRSKAIIELGYDRPKGAFFVRDNGVGFDMKYADKLFGVFQRLHLQEEFEGTGVGLASVQRIVLKHGGSVWASAEPDRGATFFFTISSDLAKDRNG